MVKRKREIKKRERKWVGGEEVEKRETIEAEEKYRRGGGGK